jgi:non-ribosomal peptide synthetase-like protein
LTVALAKRLVLRRIQPGSYRVGSALYVRKWFVDALYDASLDVVFPVYATLYVRPWLRLLGARIGRYAEVSTAAHLTPELVEMGDGAFIADFVSLAAPVVRGGVMTLGTTVVGANAFVGNSAVLPPGVTLGDEALIGCLSRPPPDLADAARPDSSWLGSPGIFLPRRQTNVEYEERYTFRPTRRLHALRYAYEAVRIVLPETVGVYLGVGLVLAAQGLAQALPLAGVVALLPVLVALAGVFAALAVALVKWLVVGRYRPGVKPLWCDFVWRTEIVAALHEQLAQPLLLNMLRGTPLLPLYFRLLGSCIGRRVVMETTCLTEFDLVEVGDDVCLDTDCDLQTHLFEDRVMKMSTVTVGDRCSVGSLALVLYDAEMGAGASLGPLSLLMKGERLPPATHWEGTPLIPRS